MYNSFYALLLLYNDINLDKEITIDAGSIYFTDRTNY